MDSITERQRLVQDLLSQVQDQLLMLENKYLEETAGVGNVVRGWEGYIDRPRTQAAVHKKDRKFKPSERIFSYSSVTAPIPLDDGGDALLPPSPGGGGRKRGGGGGDAGSVAGSVSTAGGGPAPAAPTNKRKVKRKRVSEDDDYGE
jgi:chromatin modification-related protein EAF6